MVHGTIDGSPTRSLILKDAGWIYENYPTRSSSSKPFYIAQDQGNFIFGDVAEIHVVGWLDENGARGRQIYNSREHARPVSFVVGKSGRLRWSVAGTDIEARPGSRVTALVPAEDARSST